MKTKIILLTSLAAAAGLRLAAVTDSPNPITQLPPVVVSAPRSLDHDVALAVSFPTAVRPIGREPARDALTDDLQREFKLDGFTGAVDTLPEPERVRDAIPLLDIQVTDWAVKPPHLADCTFTATLITPTGVTPLGIFTGFSLLPPTNGVVRRDPAALNQAASDAIDGLYHKLQVDHLLPSRTP